jgi:hypothetical protein
MLYWGFGFLMLAITALVVGLAGVWGLGPLTNVALLGALVFLVAGVVTFGRHHHVRRHAHR